MCKNMGCTPDYVLHEMTYENLCLYGYATPTYDPDYDEEKEWNPALDANDPSNFGGVKDEIIKNPF